MTPRAVRTEATELAFSLFGRSIHPELFDIYAKSEIRQEEFSAAIRICEAGHVIAFRSRGVTVTEVAANQRHPLPQRKQIVGKRLWGAKEESHQFHCGMHYQASFQLETLDSEEFLNFHEELLHDCRRAYLSHRFPASNRLAPEALSLIETEACPRSLLVHTFHTFPDCCSIVKTQSLFEL